MTWRMLARARDVRRDVAVRYRPPPLKSVTEGISEVLETGSGAYDPGLTPYMREPADMLAARRYHTVVVIGPARTGKTVTLIDGWIARNVVFDPGDMLVVQSSQDLARYYSKVRVKRMIEASPQVRERQSSRRQDDNTFDKLFRSGMCLAFGWPSGAQLSGRDFRYVALTEYDAAAEDIDGEGSLYVLARKRTDTYLSAGKVLVESSVRSEFKDPSWSRSVPHEAPPATGITALYNSGTMCWYHWQCEHCGEWLALDPDVHVMFDLPPVDRLAEELEGKDAAQWTRSRAHIACRSCGGEFDESRKRQLNGAGLWVASGCQIVDGQVVGEPRDTGIYSAQIPCVAAAYQSWQSVLMRYAVAIQDYLRTGSEVEIKSTVNLDQGRAYLSMHAGKRRGIESDEDTQRRENLPQGMVPAGVRFLTAQIDVQAGKRRGFVVQVTGWGRDREHWIIDRYMLRSSVRRGEDGELLPIDPAGYVEDWDRITEKCIDRRYPLADGSGRSMGVRLTVCDSGGEDGVTRRAYEFHRKLARAGKDRRFRLVKGADHGPQQREVFPDTSGRKDRSSGSAGDVPVLLLNMNLLKDTLAADLERTTPGAGYWHLPRWMDAGHVRELTAEVRTAKGWRKPTNATKNESTDLCCYGEAAYLRMGCDKINWNAPPSWAADWDHNSDVFASDEPPPRQAPRALIRVQSKSLGR